MIRRFRKTLVRAGAGTASLLSCAALLAITPDELQRELAKSNPPTVIDVRAVELFTQGHINGAINIPASLVPLKTLPKLGRVIVCGDGISSAAKNAVDALNAKPGINAELLVGGYSAWETDQRSTTGNRGLNPERTPFITYQQLQETTNNVVLVDLRKPQTPNKKASAADSKAASQEAEQPLTDLASAFPGKPVTKSTQQLPKAANAKAAAPSTPPILVLIDNGDGIAQETARQLRAQGNTRVVILTGGELTIARQGQKGSQRTGLNLENLTKPSSAK
jgi:rhodanese-related sulfurtransferase